jgi:membrane protein implicated in regulation of membrane protease activity
VYNTLEDAARAADWTVHEQQWVSFMATCAGTAVVVAVRDTVLLWVGLTITWLFSFAFFLLLLLGFSVFFVSFLFFFLSLNVCWIFQTMPKAVPNPNDTHDTSATMLWGRTVTIHPTTKEGKQVKTKTKQGTLECLSFCGHMCLHPSTDHQQTLLGSRERRTHTNIRCFFIMFSMSLLIVPYRYKGVYVASNAGNSSSTSSSSSTAPVQYYVQVVKDNTTYTLPDKYNTVVEAATAFDHMAVALGTCAVWIAPLEVELVGCRSKYWLFTLDVYCCLTFVMCLFSF